MPILHKEIFYSNLSQYDIWDNLMQYSVFNKNVFAGSNKEFYVHQEGLKYFIYSNMNTYIKFLFLKLPYRINMDMYAEIRITKDQNGKTEIAYRIIKSYLFVTNEILGKIFAIFFLLGSIIIIWKGLIFLGFLSIVMNLLAFNFWDARKKVFKIYEEKYKSLVQKII